MTIELKHQEGLQFLSDIPDGAVDLILTDPPYITSRDSGMDKWVDHVAKQNALDATDIMTEEDWQNYKTAEHGIRGLRSQRLNQNIGRGASPR